MNARCSFACTTSLVAVAWAALPAAAQDPAPSPEGLEHAFPSQKHYSPYAGRDFPTQVYWGDTHVHTSLSMDAGAFGCRLSPADAYRFARGEELTASGGLQVKLSRPLDCRPLGQHGVLPPSECRRSRRCSPTRPGRKWYDMIQAGGQEGVAGRGRDHPSAHREQFPRRPLPRPRNRRLPRRPGSRPSRQRRNTTSPGRYTALHGYEWTSTDKGANRHRVVIYRDGAARRA